MKTVQKFFDESGKEAKPENAIRCVELTIDDGGKVVGTKTYIAKDSDK